MAPASAQGEKRVALLIGNQAYNAKVGPLKNPHDDVMLVSAALRSLGFAVTAIRDADYRSMDAAIKRHAAAVRREGQGTVSLLYYSGHGANMEKNQASTALVKPRMPLTPSILAAGSLADGGCALKRTGAPIYRQLSAARGGLLG